PPAPRSTPLHVVVGPATLTTRVSVIAGCAVGPLSLCLHDARFQVRITWIDHSGQSGVGVAAPLTPDTGTFWFFSPANTEVIVKILDGGGINGHFWVFYASLSDVDYTITVSDSHTGAVKIYHNPAGTLASVAD